MSTFDKNLRKIELAFENVAQNTGPEGYMEFCELAIDLVRGLTPYPVANRILKS